MKRFLIFLLIIPAFVWLSCTKQQVPPLPLTGRAKADSLLKKLNHAKEDTNKVNILNSLSLCFLSLNRDSSLMFGKSGLSLATSLKWDKGKANSYHHIGINYYKKSYDTTMDCFKKDYYLRQKISDSFGGAIALGNIAVIYNETGSYDSAAKYFFTNIIFYRNIKNKKKLGDSYSNIGISFMKKNDYANALNYEDSALLMRNETSDESGKIEPYLNKAQVLDELGIFQGAIDNNFKALKEADKINKYNLIAFAHDNIGTLYLQQKNYAEALNHHKEALKVDEDAGDSIGKIIEYNNIGLDYFSQKNFDTAMKYYKEALRIAEKNTIKKTMDEKISSCFSNIGGVYKEWKIYDTALQFYFASMDINDSIPNLKGKSINLANIGEIYYIIKEYSKAENFYDSALSISKSIKFLTNIRDISLKMSDMYTLLRKTDKAFKYYKEYSVTKDSITNYENIKKIVGTQINYETEKKEALAKEEEKHKQAEIKKLRDRSYGLGLFGGLSLIGTFMILITNMLYFKVYFISGKLKLGSESILKYIEILGIFILIMTYEFISLLIHPLIEKLTDDNSFYMFLILIIIGVILVPSHEKIEEKIKKLFKLISLFTKEIKSAFGEIKQEFQLYQQENEIPQLFYFKGDEKEAISKANIFSFKAISTEYYIKATPIVNKKVMNLETHMIVKSKKKIVDKLIPELTVFYFFDGKHNSHEDASIQFKLPNISNESYLSNIGKVYVSTFWDYVGKIEREKLDSNNQK